MRILYFGSYNPRYARNRVILKGLKENDITIIECNSHKSIKTRFFSLIKDSLKKDFDVIFVAYPGHIDMLAAKITSLIKRKPIIFDAFISTYDTMINEWKFGTRHSPKGIYYHLLDKISCYLAYLVLLDTEEHIDYFVKEFNIKRNKFTWLPIGADEAVFCPRNKTGKSKKIQVLYYGHTNPLHGFPSIVDAAKLLKNEKEIEFLFIGDNRWFRYERDKNKNQHNVKFQDAVPSEEIPQYIANADICLGVFGTTIKAQNVIPNKAYEILAMQKPLITGDTKAARKYLKNKENSILCKTGSAEAIAESILLLKKNQKLKEKIAKNGYRLFKDNFTTKKIGEELKKIIEKMEKTNPV